MNSVMALSDRLARVEQLALKLLVAAVLLLMVLNVVTRAANLSLYWVDELAINLMVVFAFVGSSLMFAQRRNFAVTLVTDAVSPTVRRVLAITVDCINLCFAAFLTFACWVWFDPWTLASYGFDTQAFFQNTFNSVYQEVTNTIGVRRLWFFLVMPLFAVTLAIHSAACLARNLASAPEDWGHP